MIGQRLCVLARQSRLCVGLVLAWALTFAGSAQAAGQDQVVTGHATGRIISADLCPYPLLCQETTVSGQLTHLGRFTGLLSEEVDVNTGHYTGPRFSRRRTPAPFRRHTRARRYRPSPVLSRSLKPTKSSPEHVGGWVSRAN